MGSFVSSLISRHLGTGNNVKPRLRSRFEPPLNPFPGGEERNEPLKESWKRAKPDSDEAGHSDNNSGIFTRITPRQQRYSPEMEEAPVDRKNLRPSPAIPLNQEDKVMPGNPDYSSETDHHTVQKEDRIIYTDKPSQNTREHLPEDPFQPGQKPVSVTVKSNSQRTDNIPEPESSTPAILPEPDSKKEYEKTETRLTHLHSGMQRNEKLAERQGSSGRNIPEKTGTLGEPPAVAFLNRQKSERRFSGNDPQNESQPEIRVTIGQINVRAVTQTPLPENKTAVIPKPSLTLEAYLKQRDKR